MSFDLIIAQLFTGVALGAVFVLLSTGLSVIFGMLGVVNFAHGAFFMVGAYAGVFVLALTGNFWIALAAVPLLVGAMGLAVERFLVRPLYGRGPDYPLLLTFGLGYVLVEVIRILFGSDGMPFETPSLLSGGIDIEGVGYFPAYRIFVIGMTALLMLCLWLLLERTRYGLIIRAASRDPEIVAVLGINVRRVFLLVFGLGTGLAALAGLLAAPMRTVNPEMGVVVLIEAFVVTVIGGMGSLLGGAIAGMLVGIVVSLTALWMPEMSTISMFALMALVLLVRPYGLFGRGVLVK
ncbi:branched-chain amino acid ABC transporter permease [Methyloferula stellata]|uniref:branched-chain amino acid ABC transporter permease n=1 Tax=Methyloferula stellata TaxID=876270 RepID=UPI000360DF1E|nr:branched-chain amino acid ABC transporter permease [Methyloferula stellata]